MVFCKSESVTKLASVRRTVWRRGCSFDVPVCQMSIAQRHLHIRMSEQPRDASASSPPYRMHASRFGLYPVLPTVRLHGLWPPLSPAPAEAGVVPAKKAVKKWERRINADTGCVRAVGIEEGCRLDS